MSLPIINGRQAVPVRLIPIITPELGPCSLSGILANRLNIGGWYFDPDFDEIEEDVFDEESGATECTTSAEQIGSHRPDNGIVAYHLNYGTPVQMRSSEWNYIFHEIRLLEPVLRELEKKNGVPQSMEPVWRIKATKVLPPGVFLWREDMDLFWQRHTDFYGRTRFDPPYFRQPVNYNAYVRPEYQTLVWEGFEHFRIVAGDGKTVSILESKPARLIRFEYGDFIELCRVEDPSRWVRCLVIKPEGVWRLPPPDDANLSAPERALWYEYPEKDVTKPILEFPCSLLQLQAFLQDVGIHGCIDPFDLAEFILKGIEHQKKELPENQQSSSKTSSKALESLLKMVISMAVDGYGYDRNQKKSPTVKEIVAAIENQGLSIDADTVRKWLREAIGLLPRPENP